MAPRFSKNGKRLGRPPKNKSPENSGVVFSVTTPTTPVVEEKSELIVIDEKSMIVCEFVPITQHSIDSNSTSEKKLGMYSSSRYANIEDLYFKKWIVLAYLKADFKKYREEGLNNKEILQRCVNYLNAVEPRKKYAKKDPVPKYGKLELFKDDIQFTNKLGYECAILIFITDQRKNEHFWGEGERAM